MAKAEHLAILEKGIEVWNKWRATNPEAHPDLSSASLREATLDGANLTRTTLAEADLTGASLRNADLGLVVDPVLVNWLDVDVTRLRFDSLWRGDHTHLAWARLGYAELCGANLSGVVLRNADLQAADLSDTNLSGADLKQANLQRSTLSRSNLFGANLERAVLNDANLDGAEFGNAKFEFTAIGGVDLSTATGLDTVIHFGPSTIGIDTIYRSCGKISETFLRGCGLRDWEIEAVKLYDPTLSTSDLTDVLHRLAHLRGSQPFLYHSCFISYSTKDQDFADRLYADLQAKGVRCWFAPHDIRSGRKIHEQIDEAIRLHDKLLLILSEHSMSSDWVQTEIAKARKREAQEKRQMLFPVALVPYDRPADGAQNRRSAGEAERPVTIKEWECFDADRGKDSAREIREYFIPDFSNWKDHDSYQKAFTKLVADLKAQSK